MRFMNEIRCGFADGIITPALNGTFLDGYGFRMTPAETVRDDLHAKVMAVGDGDDTALVFSLDLLSLREPTWKLVIRQISSLTGVPAERIAVNSIHTHSAPVSGGIAEMPVDTDYFAHVGDVCGEIALRAMERRTEGTFAAGILPETLRHVRNRRGREPLDPSIRAAAFRDRAGNLRGVICSASCHAVVNRRMSVSADWLSVLNRHSTDEVPLLFFQGRSGDVDPCGDGGIPHDQCEPDPLIEALGNELASPVLRFARESGAKPGIPAAGEIRCVSEEIAVPMKPSPDAAALRESVKEAEREYFALAPGVEKHFALRELQWRRKMLERRLRGESNELRVPMQFFALGDCLAFAFVPVEIMTLVGNEIEGIVSDAGWPRERIYVCGCSNAVNGYLASREEFPAGGYEITGAAHWYDIAESAETSADAVTEWYRKNV